jgi:hypothetical protein
MSLCRTGQKTKAAWPATGILCGEKSGGKSEIRSNTARSAAGLLINLLRQHPETIPKISRQNKLQFNADRVQQYL